VRGNELTFSAAARKGHDEMVRLLVAHGASPAAEGRFGTPAQAAIEFGQHHTAELLRSLAHPTEAGTHRLGLHSLPPVRVVVVVNPATPSPTAIHTCLLQQEVVVYMLSFVANARDLCSLSMVPDDIPSHPLSNREKCTRLTFFDR
jgi:hypothetical protein